MLKLNNELVRSYESFVYSIIRKYATDSNRDDLFQAGMLGVTKASEKYDFNMNVKFTSFAYKYILGEVLRVLREDRNIKISRDIIKDYKRLTMARENIYKTYGRPTNNTELSEITGITEERISEVMGCNERELSLNQTISDDEKISLEDTIYNKDELDNSELLNLKDAFETLSVEEKRLLYERYYENKTQTEIAKEKKMSQVKIYRYERKILDKLKDKML